VKRWPFVVVVATFACRGVLSIDEKELVSAAPPPPSTSDGGELDASADAPANDASCTFDLASDSKNCGFCGHVCPATCSFGACTADLVGQIQGNAVALAATSDRLYWTSAAQNRIRTMAKDGTGLRTLVTAADEPVGIAVRDPWIYWATRTQIARVAIDGGAPGQIAGAQSQAAYVALDGNDLWYTRSANPGDVRHVALDGGSVSVAVDTISTPAHLALDESSVFYTADDAPDVGLWRADRTTGAKTRLHAGAVVGLAMDGASLYVGDAAASSILRVGKSGGETTLVTGAVVRGIDVDDTWVYWTSEDGFVSRVQKNGGTGQRLAIAHQEPGAIVASDPQAVYWYAGLAIFTTPKPP